MKKIIIVALFGVMAVSSTAVILPADAINTQTEQDKKRLCNSFLYSRKRSCA